MTAEKNTGVGPELHRALVCDYDTFVNWDVRLQRELPFFRTVFDEVGAQRVLDVGAGSARHAVAFASWGLTVDAIDPDETMLAGARDHADKASRVITNAGGALAIDRGGFGELAAMGFSAIDAITCTGNALPHVAGIEGLRETLADFAAVLKPGGALVLHLLNHDRLLANKQRTIMPVVREVPEGTRVFVRVVDFPDHGGEFLGFDFVTLVRDPAGEWTCASRRSAHTIITAEMLTRELEAAGFDRVELFGGHDRHALSDSDESLLAIARRAR
jgi:SAM-dependent methyltransferase